MKEEVKLKATEDPTVCVINFDLQKVLNVPRAEIGPLYFLCKLALYNFTVYSMGNHKGSCYLYNETIGGKGSNEIGSYLWMFIKDSVSKGVTDFHLFSDSCGGQNRNQNVFSMLVKAAVDFKINITVR